MQSDEVSQSHRNKGELCVEGGIDAELRGFDRKQDQSGRNLDGKSHGGYRDRAAADCCCSPSTIAQHLEIEHTDATDDESGAEDMQQVGDREQPSGMPADMPQSGMLEDAQAIGI